MNEETLFVAALERPTVAERRAFLHKACAGDVALRRRVERLLAYHWETLGILDHPVCPPRSAQASPPSTGHRAREFLARYWGVGLIIVVVLLILSGGVFLRYKSRLDRPPQTGGERPASSK